MWIDDDAGETEVVVKGAKHRGKEASKIMQMKNKYETLKKQEQFKKFSNSSFLTPEAAQYLNEVMKA
jgi:hypothetical protein